MQNTILKTTDRLNDFLALKTVKIKYGTFRIVSLKENLIRGSVPKYEHLSEGFKPVYRGTLTCKEHMKCAQKTFKHLLIIVY